MVSGLGAFSIRFSKLTKVEVPVAVPTLLLAVEGLEELLEFPASSVVT